MSTRYKFGGEEDLGSAACRKCRNELVRVVAGNAEGGLGHLVTCGTNTALFPLAVVDVAGSEKQRTRVFIHNSAEHI